MRPVRTGEEGFSLLEALAAVALTTVILTGLATIAGQWLPAWRHGFAALQAADRIGLALDRIADDVGGAEYARLDAKQGAPLFRGDADTVVFVRREIGPGAMSRLEIVRVGPAQTEAGQETQRAHARFVLGTPPVFADAVTLLAPPFRLVFAYAGEDGRWLSTWDDALKLPRAVRLTVLGKGGVTETSTAFSLKVTAAPQVAAEPQGKGGDDAAKAGK